MNLSSSTIFRFCLFLLAIVIFDLYAFRSVKTGFSYIQSERVRVIIYWIYWTVNVFFLLGLVYSYVTYDAIVGPPRREVAILAGLFVLLYAPKLVLILFLLLEDITRLFRAGVVTVGKLVSDNFLNTPYFEGRRKFISQLGLVLASIPFISILYGITKGKYNFKIHRVALKFKDLPQAFDGLTITQISDIHVGSFTNEDAVKHGIDLINEQKSDLLVFTGDLVNNFASEMKPWIPLFKQLNAPMGMYSVFGNHDYGDYAGWKTLEDKKKNHERLKVIHKELNFNLMLNENTSIEKNGERISLIGLENWGSGHFRKYGDLDKSLKGVPDDAFKILMSHDPSHWDVHTRKYAKHIHLTLAGHTHGMQFGIEIPGLKWSPVKYRYPHWAGLYEENNKYLYVNRGFGFIGFPGRVGIWPEITVITLQRG